MTQDQIIAGAQEIIAAGKPFVLATVDQQGGPQVRWMGGYLLEEPLTFYMACGATSRKMDQIAAHPAGQLMFQSEDHSQVATLSGTCEIVTDLATKRRVWDGIPGCEAYFSGPEAADFGVIRFVCRRVELLGLKESHEPNVAEL
jgi:general stress protein 26